MATKRSKHTWGSCLLTRVRWASTLRKSQGEMSPLDRVLFLVVLASSILFFCEVVWSILCIMTTTFCLHKIIYINYLRGLRLNAQTIYDLYTIKTRPLTRQRDNMCVSGIMEVCSSYLRFCAGSTSYLFCSLHYLKYWLSNTSGIRDYRADW